MRLTLASQHSLIDLNELVREVLRQTAEIEERRTQSGRERLEAERQRVEAATQLEERRIQAEKERLQALAQVEQERQQAEREAERQRIEAAAEAERQRLEAIAATERDRLQLEAMRAEAAATAERDRAVIEQRSVEAAILTERERVAAERERAAVAAAAEEQRIRATAAAEEERFDALINTERERAATAAAAEQQRVAAVTSSPANVDRERAAAAREAEQRFEAERQRIAAEKERAAEERKASEAARAAEIERLQAECKEERARRLQAEQQLTSVSQATGTFAFSLLPPPPTHTPFNLTFKSLGAPPPPCNTPRRSTPSVVVPTAHRWVPVSYLPTTTQDVNYAFLSSGPASCSDFVPAAVTHTVPALPSLALSFASAPAVLVSKAQLDVPPLVAHPSIPPAPVVTQPQVVLVKQFQQPKPYAGASSWKGYREYFERLAAVNGRTTTEQKTEQLALALERAQPVRYFGTWIPPSPKPTVLFGRLWHAASVLWMALERPCVALTLGAKRTTRQFQILSKPFVPYIGRLGLLLPRTAGCRFETSF